MTFQVIFSVEGDPVGKQRPRFSRNRTYTPKKTVEYEKLIADKAQEAMGASEPLKTPVAVYLHVNMPVPRSYSKRRLQACLAGLERPIKKVGDLDNVVKSVLDAMNAVVYVDDCQVVSIHATKIYATIPSVNVCVSEVLP